jgi:membrane protease subunit (stomatin/prohibitin family)
MKPNLNAPPAQFSPDGKLWWDGSAWHQLSPDGKLWWDGGAWQSLPVDARPDLSDVRVLPQTKDQQRQARDAAMLAHRAAEQTQNDARRRLESEAKTREAAERNERAKTEQAEKEERRRVEAKAKAEEAVKRDERQRADQAAAQARATEALAAAAKVLEDRQAAIEAQVSAALAGEPLPSVTKFISDDQRYRWNGSKWKPFDVAKEGGTPLGALAGGGRSFIARPESSKADLIFKWPDRNLRKWSQVTVEADELAVFFRDGLAHYVLPPGRWTLDSYELPILSKFLDARTGGNFFLTELYFVTIRELPNLPFAGSIDNVVDPQSNIAVSLKAEGSYSLKVTNPKTLITRLAGTGSTDSSRAATAWVAGILMKVLRTEVVEEILSQRWAMLGIVQHSDEIEVKVLERVAPYLQTYGLSIVRFGDFLVELPTADAETLKGFSKDIQYSKLAGGYGQYSVGKAMQGVGEGAALGGGGSSPALLGLGLNLGSFAQGALGAAAAPSQVVHVRCPSCSQLTDESASYCAQCGAKLAPPTPQMSAPGWKCPTCQRENAADAMFCSKCGTKALVSETKP